MLSKIALNSAGSCFSVTNMHDGFVAFLEPNISHELLIFLITIVKRALPRMQFTLLQL